MELNLAFGAASPEPSFAPQVDHGEMLRRIQVNSSNNPFLLDFMAAQVVAAVKARTGGTLYPLSHPQILQQLTETGYGTINPALTSAQLADIHTYLSDKPVLAAHNAAYSQHQLGSVEEFRSEPQAAYRYADLLHAPHLLELALDPTVLGIVSHYLGCMPMISEMNMLWSNPAEKRATYGQTFHRDLNDFRWVTMFVYLTDVGPGSGPHCFVPGTHRTDLFTALLQQKLQDARVSAVAAAAGIDPAQLPLSAYEHGYNRFDAFYEIAFADSVDLICGPAGMAFLEDTRGLHFGKPPTHEARLCFWVVYGLYENNCWAHSPVEPVPFDRVRHRIPDNSMTRYVTQALFRS